MQGSSASLSQVTLTLHVQMPAVANGMLKQFSGFDARDFRHACAYSICICRSLCHYVLPLPELLWTGGLVVVLQQDDRPNAGADHSRPNQQVMVSVWLRLNTTSGVITLQRAPAQLRRG